VVHCDVKHDNLLFDAANEFLLLTDFGESLDVDNAPPSEVGGTVQYMAPEVLGGNAKLSPLADMWSAGVVFFEWVISLVCVCTVTTPLVLPLCRQQDSASFPVAANKIF
jgi:serine/threonine protein kinase